MGASAILLLAIYPYVTRTVTMLPSLESTAPILSYSFNERSSGRTKKRKHGNYFLFPLL